MPDTDLIILKYKIKFDGRDADSHRLEAYPAAHTLEGLSWALALTLNFGVTGDIRKRGDLSSSAKIFISPPTRGSVVNELTILIQQNPFLTSIVGAYAVNTVTPYINGLIGHVFGQALGAASKIPRGAAKFIRKLDGDDVEELVERIEPPLTRAHTVIGRTADTITFRSKRTDIAILNAQTKAYLEATPSDTFQTLNTNVTSFNLLTGNGRLFNPEDETTVPFSLIKDSLNGSADWLISSMWHYSHGYRGTIKITAQRVETIEGHLKKFLVSAAEGIPQTDWEDNLDPLNSPRA